MTSFQTFETTGFVDENGVLQVEPFVGVPAGRVRVSLAVPLETKEDEDYTLEPIGEEAWHRSIITNPVFAFLADPAEDIYTLEDGEPLPPLRAGDGA